MSDFCIDVTVFYNRFAGRNALLDYAASKGIPVFQTAAKPWSTGEREIWPSSEPATDAA